MQKASNVARLFISTGILKSTLLVYLLPALQTYAVSLQGTKCNPLPLVHEGPIATRVSLGL